VIQFFLKSTTKPEHIAKMMEKMNNYKKTHQISISSFAMIKQKLSA